MDSVNGFRSSHAVVIGINDYQHGIPRLRTAVNDARRIAEVLETRFGYSVQLLAEDVTRDRLITLFAETLPRAVHGDDRILVYFAGHGIALDGDDGPAGFLVAQDARPDDRRTFLPMTDLNGWLNRLPCRHLLLVLDCCFAGAFRWANTRELGTVPEVLHKERFDRYVRDPAWQVITSAAYDQKALDVLSGAAIGLRAPDVTAGDHSPFAAGFVRALQGEADLYPRAVAGRPGGDGVITATELYLYLRGCVEDDSEGDGHRQTPGLWPLNKHDKGEYIHLVPGHELNLPPAPELNEANNPYRGLQSYDEEHASVFFGRGQFVAKLAERVSAQPLTIVLGASGTGKSSVVKAGLVSYLRGKEPAAWQIMPPIRPGKSPLASLASLTLPGELTDLATHLAEFWTDAGALASRVGAWAAREPAGRLLLVVDQFEELITLCWDAGERERFLKLLEAAVASDPDRLRVVLTLRSDFEPQFAHTPLQERWMPARIVVPAMTLDEYREVIEGPASVRVLYFQGKTSSQEFINRLIGDVANTPGALPLLSFTLSELYRRYLERRGDDRSLQEGDYERLGGVGGSLRNRANEVYEGLPDEASRAMMRRVMLRMVSVEGGEIARRRVPDDELVYEAPADNLRVSEVVRKLTDARLVVEGNETDDQPYVEPAHDELIRGWDRLLLWTRTEAEALHLRRRLTPAAVAWNQRNGGLWLSEPRLGLFKKILKSPDNWMNEVERRFLRRSLVVRGTLAISSAVVLGMALLIISALGLVARSQRNEAVSARDESEHALSRSLLSPIGNGPPKSVNPYVVSDPSPLDFESLWKIATLSEKQQRVRFLFLEEAIRDFASAHQLRTRVDAIVQSAVGLDDDLRRRVLDEIVLPTLRDKKQSRDAFAIEVRMACAEVGDQLDALKTPHGPEFAQLAVSAALDSIQSAFLPDLRVLGTLKRNTIGLDGPSLESLKVKVAALSKEHDDKKSSREYQRASLLRAISSELKVNIDHVGPTNTPATAPTVDKGAAGAGSSPFHVVGARDAYVEGLAARGPVESSLYVGSHQQAAQPTTPPLRGRFKKISAANRAEALAEMARLNGELAKPEPDYFDSSVAILGWAVSCDAIASQLPETARDELVDKITDKLLAKLSKTVLIHDFAEAFLMLARYRKPEGNYKGVCLALLASSRMLAGWENPAQFLTSQGVEVQKSFNFSLLILRSESLNLTNAQLINILKFPICLGELRRIVLSRLAAQMGPRPKGAFENKWDFVTDIKAGASDLYALALRPPEIPD
jgi:hypothetical protein